MKNLPKVDAVIIGGGWSGLLMASQLGSRTALSVAVIERGGARKLADYMGGMDELEFNVRFRMMQDYSQETVTLRYNMRDRAVPIRQLGNFLPGTGTGGAGEHWGAVCPRYVDDLFQLYTKTVERYGAKKLPEDHAIVDWGLTWADIEPYYTRGDKLMGVSGKAGNIKGKLIEGGNPFEGARSEEYPTPPMKLPYASALFRTGGEVAGLSPVSESLRDHQPGLYESRRHLASRLRVLRILRPLRLHDRREIPADQYPAADCGEAKERFAAQQLRGAPHRLR